MKKSHFFLRDVGKTFRNEGKKIIFLYSCTSYSFACRKQIAIDMTWNSFFMLIHMAGQASCIPHRVREALGIMDLKRIKFQICKKRGPHRKMIWWIFFNSCKIFIPENLLVGHFRWFIFHYFNYHFPVQYNSVVVLWNCKEAPLCFAQVETTWTKLLNTGRGSYSCYNWERDKQAGRRVGGCMWWILKRHSECDWIASLMTGCMTIKAAQVEGIQTLLKY